MVSSSRSLSMAAETEAQLCREDGGGRRTGDGAAEPRQAPGQRYVRTVPDRVRAAANIASAANCYRAETSLVARREGLPPGSKPVIGAMIEIDELLLELY